MVTKTDAYPDIAIPPGEYLAEEIEDEVSLKRNWRGAWGGRSTQ